MEIIVLMVTETNVLTFNTLINAFCKEGMAKEAENVLEFMVQRGVGPVVVTYNTLTDGYCLLGHMDRAIEVFHSMVDKGIEPNILCYNILINGYCKNIKIEEKRP
ncbi:pentatricopeptide repeat-containing protein At1g12775, mitochondrial-like isoform X2 [Camellia sinensis]|uniref:pentatricopeptide repeat-containing protein At1g12775, mitochondrial-like isoform X2 n=1 Tax=Camellia sinensis TaxID=4442 RepID=UPI00103582D5|nr:pentatricopeptide repeat-containing protein At1g12775, mitochondrial-like isoform X2 [Camellia sinensis]